MALSDYIKLDDIVKYMASLNPCEAMYIPSSVIGEMINKLSHHKFNDNNEDIWNENTIG